MSPPSLAASVTAPSPAYPSALPSPVRCRARATSDPVYSVIAALLAAACTTPVRICCSCCSDQSAPPATAAGAEAGRPSPIRCRAPSSLPTVSRKAADNHAPTGTCTSTGCTGCPSHTPCSASRTRPGGSLRTTCWTGSPTRSSSSAFSSRSLSLFRTSPPASRRHLGSPASYLRDASSHRRDRGYDPVVSGQPNGNPPNGTNRTPLRRRTVPTGGAAGLGAVALGAASHGAGLQRPPPARIPVMTGYAPDGPAGLTRAFPLNQVQLRPGAFAQNQRRNTSYLLFLDPARLLRAFRINYGLEPAAEPCGGWEAPRSLVRGHNTGHLMSALALTWASTGNREARDKGRDIVRQLAALQGRAAAAGFNPGYLSAFPEQYFDRLEAGLPVWSPYYMIHKYLAGFIDQYQLAGDETALEAAISLADWGGWRAGRLSYDHMQRVLEVEYGGLPESLANLYPNTRNDQSPGTTH